MRARAAAPLLCLGLLLWLVLRLSRCLSLCLRLSLGLGESAAVEGRGTAVIGSWRAGLATLGLLEEMPCCDSLSLSAQVGLARNR